MNNTTLQRANKAFRSKDYKTAYKLYQQCLKETPSLHNIISDNLKLVELKLKQSNEIIDPQTFKDKVIVYTCNFGDYESIKEPLLVDSSVEYILFTDNKNLKSKYWEIIYLEDALQDPRRTSRLPKILAHKYLPAHDISVYVDSSLELKTLNIREMVDECLEGNDIALYKHYMRDCVYDEINFVMNSTDRVVADKELCKKAIEKYQVINYPQNSGLFENAFIVRRNTARINELNELWWQEYQTGTERDQFVLMYALWQKKIQPNAIKHGKQFRENPYVNFYKHQYVESSKTNRLAIVVHVYYLEVWEIIKQQLAILGQDDFDIFITSSPEKCRLIKARCFNKFKNIQFLEVENKGMDVFPFIKAIKEFNLDGYDVVLKLHTKNIKSNERKLQGDITFSSLLNKSVISRVKNNKNGHFAIYPGIFGRSIDGLMYGNRKLVEQISQFIELDHDKGSYFSAGTMFWISGALLRPLKDSYSDIESLFDSIDAIYQTGADGSPAHAFERVFGMLVEDKNLELAFRLDSKNLNYTIVNADESAFFKEKIANSGSTDHIYLQESASFHAASFANSNLFDMKFYSDEISKNSLKIPDLNHSPAVNAILYGEVINADPSKEFSTSFYKLANQDVLRARKSAVCHFLTNGQREKHRKYYPRYSDVYDLLINYLPLVQANREYLISVNIKFGNIEKLLSEFGEGLDNNKFLSELDYDLLKPFFGLILDSYYDFQRFKRSYQNHDFVEAEKVAKFFYNAYGETRASLEALAACLLINKKFGEASLLYESFWSKVINEKLSKNPLYGSVPYDNQSPIVNNQLNFNSIEPILIDGTFIPNKKICIYTSLYGDIDQLPPILTHVEGVDFICFSDRRHPNSDWKVIIEPAEFEDNNLNAKRFKILPHKYLAAYDASIFVDANTYLCGNLNELINVYLNSSDFAMFVHPERSDIYQEVSAIIGHLRHRPKEVIEQLQDYFKEGLPHNTGLVEGSFIWRKHDNNVLNSFMEEWWQHILKYSKRDQISLGYLMWKNNLKPKVLPKTIGDSRNNIYFRKLSHQQDLQTPESASTPRDLVFLYKEKYKNAGSTVMRGFQLFDMISLESQKTKIENVANIRIENEKSTIKNSIIFLTKGYLLDVNVEELSKLKTNNNVLIADYVDGKVNKEILGFFDVLIAASISGYLDYRTKYQDVKVGLLTHHVDPRIEALCKKNNTRINKAAYFGEFANTYVSDELQKFVDFHSVDTSGKDKSNEWLQSVPKYQYHFAVRRKRGIDGYKPFTKGFTAACAGAYLILNSDEADARYYLGNHYPFYVSIDEEHLTKEVRKVISKGENQAIENLVRSYMENMRKRSSPEFVLNEFNKILRLASSLG